MADCTSKARSAKAHPWAQNAVDPSALTDTDCIMPGVRVETFTSILPTNMEAGPSMWTTHRSWADADGATSAAKSTTDLSFVMLTALPFH